MRLFDGHLQLVKYLLQLLLRSIVDSLFIVALNQSVDAQLMLQGEASARIDNVKKHEFFIFKLGAHFFITVEYCCEN